MPPAPYRRPLILDDAVAESIIGDPDPADSLQIAHATARAVLVGGRGRAGEPEILGRLVHLVEDEGIEAVAQLWAKSQGDSLPGALWRLYVIREWVRRDPRGIALHYASGLAVAEVAGVIAGVPEPPTPDDISATADRILTGVFDGDLDVALERAAALLQVLATGTARNADGREAADERAGRRMVHRAAALLRTADELRRAAALERRGELE